MSGEPRVLSGAEISDTPVVGKQDHSEENQLIAQTYGLHSHHLPGPSTHHQRSTELSM
jgi:hypothetical protein